MATVHLDAMLGEFVRVREVQSKGPDVRAMLEELEGRYPRLTGKLRDETGAIRRFVRIFVNGVDVRGREGLATALGPADQVDILHSIAGG
jgi:molybdopterin converting factor small subunit